jgi:hypothetical protein
VARWTVIAGLVMAVGVAAAATKLKRPSAGDACLCTPDAQAPTDLSAALESAPGTASYSARAGVATPPGSNSVAGALVGAPLGTNPAYAGAGGASTAVSMGVAGWSAGGRAKGAYSASSAPGHSAALGGLWRLMSLSRKAPAAAAHAAVIRTASTKQPRTAKAPKPRGSGGGTGASAVAATPAAELFAEQTTTIPDLLNGTGTVTTPGGRLGKPKDSGALAATPEPGSLFLLGTGLVGIAGLLRKRLA